MNQKKLENCKQLCQQLVRKNQDIELAMKNYSKKIYELALKEILVGGKTNCKRTWQKKEVN